MTLEGTNTWVLAAPGARAAVVVDPGPEDAAHRAALLAHLAGRALRCALVLTTHHHHDHADGVDAFAAAAGSPPVLLAQDAREGEVHEVDGLRLVLLRTPGHTADSVCALVEGERSLLTGDSVLGRGSTVLAPGGDLASYLSSLRRLVVLDAAQPLGALLPGHGPARPDARAALAVQLEHRLQRLEQVRAALDAGAPDVDAVVSAVHGVPREALLGTLADAARTSVRAQLAHLGVELPG
ncbi:MBL fold metallo-hydrolase [Kineococcus indalonis]|uniref:MBL fold metallo-hydrolase n=1 Tax=Kineococcus indalonis TaxID=2696566 RepID=UPI0014125113|nr:MBL fold metallo-hydrolase [Kineococcus indalonis]NAZ86134.1 MBL fold metallo-hydrolase [Kineococcus indalonis]